MKKRSLAVILAAAMMFSMTACGNKAETVNENTTTAKVSDEKTDAQEEETPSKEEETPVEEDEVEEGLVEEETDTKEADAEEEETASGRYERGTYAGNSWTSKWLGMRYDLPDEFLFASEEELDAMIVAGGGLVYEDDAQTMLDYAKMTTVYEMMVLEPAGNPNFNLAVERSPYSPDEYMEILEMQLAALDNVSVDWKGYAGTEDIGGLDFDKYDVELDYGGIAMNQSYYITAKENRLVYIILTYTDDTLDAADTMMGGFSAL